jgi:hypothetical protein
MVLNNEVNKLKGVWGCLLYVCHMSMHFINMNCNALEVNSSAWRLKLAYTTTGFTCNFSNDLTSISQLFSFLRGSCEVGDCTLSHDVGPEKMPTCKYFLEGCCVRDSCPYLHVKVSAKADICKNFLRGYCPDGREVSKTVLFLSNSFIATLRMQVVCSFYHNSDRYHESKRLFIAYISSNLVTEFVSSEAFNRFFFCAISSSTNAVVIPLGLSA